MYISLAFYSNYYDSAIYPEAVYSDLICRNDMGIEIQDNCNEIIADGGIGIAQNTPINMTNILDIILTDMRNIEYQNIDGVYPQEINDDYINYVNIYNINKDYINDNYFPLHLSPLAEHRIQNRNNIISVTLNMLKNPTEEILFPAYVNPIPLPLDTNADPPDNWPPPEGLSLAGIGEAAASPLTIFGTNIKDPIFSLDPDTSDSRLNALNPTRKGSPRLSIETDALNELKKSSNIFSRHDYGGRKTKRRRNIKNKTKRKRNIKKNKATMRVNKNRNKKRKTRRRN
jgi:hypothetical protein